MPIVSNASNKQMNVGKIQIKGGGGYGTPPLYFTWYRTMAFSNGSPPWHLSHRFSVENKEHKRTYTKPEQRSFEERRGEWEGTNKREKAAR